MSRTFLAALFAACCAVPAGAHQVGDAVAPLELSGAVGPVRVGDGAGRVLYVDFWASWCGPCKLSFPFMNDLQGRYGARGLQVVGISLDRKRADAERFLAALPAQFTVAFDPAGVSAERFRPQGMPTSYVIGTDGKVRAIHVGFREGDRAAIERAIVAALAEAGR